MIRNFFVVRSRFSKEFDSILKVTENITLCVVVLAAAAGAGGAAAVPVPGIEHHGEVVREALQVRAL